MPETGKEKILLDTDIGSDIDDAICLAYLLSQPRCELMGITTVSGEPEKRAMMASAICLQAGRPDIPIYPGTTDPLLTPQMQPLARQAAVLSKWPHQTEFPVGGHIEFMRRVIRENPHEITLLAIGPMTNVALLFSVDPEIPSLLKQLVVMCGVFSFRLPYVCLTEWNARCDPFATSIMYRARTRVTRSVGLDVTTRVTMNREEVAKRFTAKVLQPVLDFAGVWFTDSGVITFHDPLAAVAIFEPDVCRFERGDIDVELESSRTKGLTYWSANPEGKDEVAVSVDADRFFEAYFAVVQ